MLLFLFYVTNEWPVLILLLPSLVQRTSLSPIVSHLIMSNSISSLARSNQEVIFSGDWGLFGMYMSSNGAEICLIPNVLTKTFFPLILHQKCPAQTIQVFWAKPYSSLLRLNKVYFRNKDCQSKIMGFLAFPKEKLMKLFERISH